MCSNWASYFIVMQLSGLSCFSFKMPRPRSARSDNSDADMEGLAEQELAKLQRQYRIMENDRGAYTEESQNVIRKQK